MELWHVLLFLATYVSCHLIVDQDECTYLLAIHLPRTAFSEVTTPRGKFGYVFHWGWV
jgi:hypothetical protein